MSLLELESLMNHLHPSMSWAIFSTCCHVSQSFLSCWSVLLLQVFFGWFLPRLNLPYSEVVFIWDSGGCLRSKTLVIPSRLKQAMLRSPRLLRTVMPSITIPTSIGSLITLSHVNLYYLLYQFLFTFSHLYTYHHQPPVNIVKATGKSSNLSCFKIGKHKEVGSHIKHKYIHIYSISK